MVIMKNEKLKQARQKQCLTQVQVADKAHISERAYQRYEAGEQNPNAKTAKEIAKILKCKVEDIF